MARLLTTGFELNSTTANEEWDTYSSVTISSTTKRTGSYALRVNAAASAPFWRALVYSANQTNSAYVRFYLYIASATNTNTQIFRIINVSNVQQACIQLTTANKLQLLNGSIVQVGSDSAALNTGQWYQVEVYWNPSTGATSARIDGVEFANGTGTTGSWGRILLGIPTGTPTTDLYFDDVAVNDSTGSAQTSWPGPGKVIYLRPNAAGDSNEFATRTGGTAGATNNYTRVNEVNPDDATTYNGSSTLNQEDMFNVGDSGIGSTDPVAVVHVGLRFRNSTADTAAVVKAQIKKTSGGTTTQSSNILPNSTTWKSNALATPWLFPLTLYTDPDGSTWTKSTLDSMQIGYKLTTGPAVAGRRIDVSNVWSVVDYAPKTQTTKTHTTDALIRKQFTVSHSTDSHLAVSGGSTTYTKTHTSDALLKKQTTKTHTSNALLRTQNTKSHTGNALIRKQSTKTHTTNALVRAQTAKTHTTNALLRKQSTKDHTTSAFLRLQISKTHTTNAVIRKQSTKTHSTDGLIKKQSIQTHTTNALIKKQIVKAHTTDAYLSASSSTVTKTHTTNALIKKQSTKTHSTSAFLRLQLTKTHSTNSLVRKQTVKTHTTSSFTRLQLTKTHSTNSLIKKQTTKTHTTSAVIRKQSTKTHTTDAKLKKVFAFTHTSDAVIRKQSTKTHSTDSMLFGSTKKTHTTDAYIMLKGYERKKAGTKDKNASTIGATNQLQHRRGNLYNKNANGTYNKL